MLLKTWILMNEYGDKLRDGSITDLELDKLLSADTFTRSEGEFAVDPGEVSDKNHTRSDAVRDFVRGVALHLDDGKKLQALTLRMIGGAGHKSQSAGLHLEEAFLACELAMYPAHAKEYSIDTVAALQPHITHFQNPSPVKYSEDIKIQAGFIYWLKTLQDKMNTLGDVESKKQIQKLIDHVNTVEPQQRKYYPELISALKNTCALLNGDMSLENYKVEAKKAKGHEGAEIQIAGAIMFALGMALVIAGIVLCAPAGATAAAVTAGAILASVGGPSALMGLGMFAAGTEAVSLSKKMSNVSNSVEKTRETSSSLI